MFKVLFSRLPLCRPTVDYGDGFSGRKTVATFHRFVNKKVYFEIHPHHQPLAALDMLVHTNRGIDKARDKAYDKVPEPSSLCDYDYD